MSEYRGEPKTVHSAEHAKALYDAGEIDMDLYFMWKAHFDQQAVNRVAPPVSQSVVVNNAVAATAVVRGGRRFHWLAYVLVGVCTAGIGFLFFPLFWW